MHILMSGLDYSRASIELRESLSFTRAAIAELLPLIRKTPGINGCVLISTCNRTELFLSSDRPLDASPAAILCKSANADFSKLSNAFVSRYDKDAVVYLAEVAAGLHSQIWGDDQILSQIRQAISIARETKCSSPVLETLFRSAVSAGKDVKSSVYLSEIPASAPAAAVDFLTDFFGDLNGKNALVIGNGEMGRLAANLLHNAGCNVTVTLRTYKHGVTAVPPGCATIPYDLRFAQAECSHILFSATTSPHFTVTADQLAGLNRLPDVFVDLAVPRDIQPDVANLPGVRLLNVDSIATPDSRRIVPDQVSTIINAHVNNFFEWLNYREALPAIENVKNAIVDRIIRHSLVSNDLELDDIVQIAVSRTVDLLAGNLKDCLSADKLERCYSKIRANTSRR